MAQWYFVWPTMRQSCHFVRSHHSWAVGLSWEMEEKLARSVKGLATFCIILYVSSYILLCTRGLNTLWWARLSRPHNCFIRNTTLEEWCICLTQNETVLRQTWHTQRQIFRNIVYSIYVFCLLYSVFNMTLIDIQSYLSIILSYKVEILCIIKI